MHPNIFRPIRNALYVALCLLIFAAACAAQQVPTETGILVMAKSTNFDRFLGAGLVYKMSDTWAVVADGYTGGGMTGAQSQALLLVQLSPEATLFAAAGPELNIIQTNPTLEEKYSYVMAATTLGFSYRVNKQTSTWIAIDRLDGNAPVANWKLSFGLVLWTTK